ncbi:MAG: PEP-CTERM sorting domain-containing protein [Pseudomonadota bacterium]|nr:PEP-CTERM sorting domain-containing protein [Pseudomonadota bacterium]
MPNRSHLFRLSQLAMACALGLSQVPSAHAVYDWNWSYLTNPNWEIGLTDFGYSDYLFDQTPGFVGREYLSGEWGAAVGYKKGDNTITPTWLEPRFAYPDWDTNSNFSVTNAMTVDLGANGLPTASSTIGNGDLSITQNISFVDTLTGTPMGRVAASAGAGSAYSSNRYVMLQSYSITNTSSETLSNLQFFQLLHGMSSQNGVFDNRAYAGAMSDYRYDITLGGDASASGTTQYDYIGLSSKTAPSAIEIGSYGVFLTDNHGTGKPSVGVHLSVEDNKLTGLDSFASTTAWVSGAARWDMATLAPGESANIEVMLTILTGWQVSASTSSGIGNGSADLPPGTVGYEFLGEHSGGQFFFSYEAEDWDSVQEMAALGEFDLPNFQIPGGQLQLFEVEFDGDFSGQLKLSFSYDPTLLPADFDEASLNVFHWTGSTWESLGGTVDAGLNTITVETDSLSPFAVAAAVPEPETWAMLLAGMGLIGFRLAGRATPRTALS